MVIPPPFLIGEDKYEIVTTRSHIFHLENKTFKANLADGLTEFCYMPTKFSKISLLAVTRGFLINQYVTGKLIESGKLKPGRPFVFIEHYGSGFYLLLVNEDGTIESELIEEVLSESELSRASDNTDRRFKANLDFDQDKFDLLINRIEIFVNSKKEIVQGFVASAAGLSQDIFSIDGLIHTSQERIKEVLESIRIGKVISFDLADANSDKSFIKVGVADSVVDLYVPNASQVQPFITELTIEYYKKDLELNDLPTSYVTRDVGQYLKRKHYTRFGLSLFALLAVVASTIPSYLEQKKIEEAEKNRIVQIQRTIDEYAEYRKLILETGINAEMMLKQIGLAIMEFDKARDSKELSWRPVTIAAENTNISFEMKSTSSKIDSTNLSDFAEKNGLAQFFLNNNQIVGFGASHYAVNAELYLTPVDKEIHYIQDTVDFLFDHTNVSIGQRTAHQNWSSVMVDINYNCWLPQHFEYFSTQLYPRNYGFVKVEGTYSDEATVEDQKNKIMPCGYSGKITLEVYGHKGTGLSSSTKNEAENG
ncbi:hypothetical protein NB550_11150 [Vibrio parahaemolyticus]|uniref:hypothetical protein n=1 Tax=Vibrio TaxID=662 RepID=UPI00215C5D23|nr:hypothetical protein [Vibrio parahaemolyticus]MCR9888116.1 hypothetical protein [Vibrio parahaemolyticus]MCR9918046.1 hypothetical protein [Vibrio parahaemolyticus]WHT06064.1 hypothetical protein O2T11_25790 [Vibrio parahaemolyticus]